MPSYIVTRATKATTNHHFGNPATFISSRMCLVRGVFFFVFTKKIKNWILEILLCWSQRFHMHGRVRASTCDCRSVVEVFSDFFFCFFLDLLETTSLGRFLSRFGESVSEGGSTAECHDEVEETCEPVARGACSSSMADAKHRLA